jgi:trk system potassium uptake protein TrkA
MIVVIGMGRFGTALSSELLLLGHEVLGIDTDEGLVQAASGDLTHVVQADATDEATLRQLGIPQVRHAVVAIGDAVQASILTTAALSDLGVPDIWAKAQTEQHARILERVGANHVIFPERDMGQRVAHRVTGRMLDYIQIDETFVLIETSVPARFVGQTLLQADIRKKYGVTVVSIKPAEGTFHHTTADTILGADDLLLVAGTVEQVDAFAAQA